MLCWFANISENMLHKWVCTLAQKQISPWTDFLNQTQIINLHVAGRSTCKSSITKYLTINANSPYIVYWFGYNATEGAQRNNKGKYIFSIALSVMQFLVYVSRLSSSICNPSVILNHVHCLYPASTRSVWHCQYYSLCVCNMILGWIHFGRID